MLMRLHVTNRRISHQTFNLNEKEETDKMDDHVLTIATTFFTTLGQHNRKASNEDTRE